MSQIETVNVALKKGIQDSVVSWYTKDDGTYGVELFSTKEDNLPPVSLKKWEFGENALAESISFYWYEQMLVKVKHMYDDRFQEDILSIISHTSPQQIEQMCKKAIQSTFLF